jgi:hypothetical protein
MILSSFVPAPRVIGMLASKYTGRPCMVPTAPSPVGRANTPTAFVAEFASGTTRGRVCESRAAVVHAQRRGCMRIASAGANRLTATCWIASASFGIQSSSGVC